MDKKKLIEAGKRLNAKLGRVPDTCQVRDCNHPTEDVIELRPLDPIDHESTLLPACEHHLEWGQERNQLAEEVGEELREYRKELGQERKAEIARLASPQEGDLREDILMGRPKEPFIHYKDATETPEEVNSGE